MSAISTSRLKEYVRRSKDLLENNPNLNETSTKAKLITPLIEILGWDVYSDEVEFEYTLRIATTIHHVDYALKLEDVPVVLIEAKPVGTNITDTEARQVIDYGRTKDIEWVAVANGKQFEIYNAEWGSSREECRIASIRLEDFVNQRDKLSLLSKESVKSGKITRIVEEIRDKQRSLRRIKEAKPGLSKNIAEILKDKVHEGFYREIEDFSQSFLDNLVEKLESRVSTKTMEQEKATLEKDVEIRPSPQPKKVKPANAQKIKIKNQVLEVDSARDILLKTANYLFDHNYLDGSDVPISSGRKRYIINKEKKHRDGSSFIEAKQLNCGFYLEVNNDAQTSFKYAKDLLEEAKLDRDLLQIVE